MKPRAILPSSLAVLIVEDRPIMLKILRKLLAVSGIEDIDTALNGREALGLIEKRTYNLILSDWNMDDVSGLELLKCVRSDPRSAGVPFVLVTAEAKPENVLAAKRAGVDGYIIKPFGAEALMETIVEALARRPLAA